MLKIYMIKEIRLIDFLFSKLYLIIDILTIIKYLKFINYFE